MLSELQQHKLGYMFDVYDSNKDGYVEESDFAQVQQRFDSMIVRQPAGGGNWFLGFWQGLAQVAGPDGRVSRDTWLTYLDNLWSQPAVYEATIEAGVAFYFEALDTNGDGKLSSAEYRVFFQVMNLDPDLADQVFPRMDLNHDGAISHDEYRQCVRDFYGDDANAPGNWLLGPI